MRIKMLLASLIVCLSGVSQAALFDRGGGMIYDDVLDITWLQNANLGGSMNWPDSVVWADGLEYGGFDDWRLPSADLNLDGISVECRTATELACRDNELGYMYYHNTVTFFDQGLFTNVQFDHWSGTVAPNPIAAWAFGFNDGFNVSSNQDFFIYGAWAVRGDNVVPLPAGIWLLGTGLIGLMLVRRRG